LFKGSDGRLASDGEILIQEIMKALAALEVLEENFEGTLVPRKTGSPLMIAGFLAITGSVACSLCCTHFIWCERLQEDLDF
jgi:hypothetical protein